MATVIIGVAFTAMLELLATGTVSNKQGAQLTTAIHLAGNVREAAIRTPYDDIWTLEGTYSPPVDAAGNDMAGMNGWQQVVDIDYVDVNLLTNAVPDDQEEPTARVTVTVTRHGSVIHRTSWLAAASN